MEKITFKNGQEPAINGTNLNQLQTNMENAINELYNIFHPIGSYYETSDANFNPNTAWGGTWELDSKGRVTVSQDEEQEEFATVGQTGGSKYLQEHNHDHYEWVFNGESAGGSHYGFGHQANNGALIKQQSYSTSGEVQYGNAPAGTGDSENLQPYIVVLRWHRIA